MDLSNLKQGLFQWSQKCLKGPTALHFGWFRLLKLIGSVQKWHGIQDIDEPVGEVRCKPAA